MFMVLFQLVLMPRSKANGWNPLLLKLSVRLCPIYLLQGSLPALGLQRLLILGTGSPLCPFLLVVFVSKMMPSGWLLRSVLPWTFACNIRADVAIQLFVSDPILWFS